MKTCMVSALPPSHSGVALYTYGLASGFQEIKIPFPLVIIANKSAKPGLDIKKVEIIRSWTKGPQFFFQILSAIIHENPSVVHFQHEFFLYGGILAALIFPMLLLSTKILRKKIVVTIHGVVPQKLATTEFAKSFFVTTNFFILKYGLGILIIIICKLANTIIVHNNFSKGILVQDYKIKPQKIRIIRHGVGPNKTKNRTSSKQNTVLFFGNMTPSKGIETLISAFEQIQIPNTKLIIAGGSHPRGKEYFLRIKQRTKISPVSKNIVLKGYIPYAKIHKLFEECTLAVFPYIWSVSSSGGLALALQHQKPVIVTAQPSFVEMIKNGRNGIVVPPKDPKALAIAIKKILFDKKLQQVMSKKNGKDYSNLLWTNIAVKTLECYQKWHMSPIKD